jgi:hypothetical protein
MRGELALTRRKGATGNQRTTDLPLTARSRNFERLGWHREPASIAGDD